VAPTLPLGAHSYPMRADADHSLRAITRLVAEFLERLDLGNVTVVGNDTGGALVQLLICEGAARVERIVLVSCDAFDNFPPGLTGKTLVLTGKLSPTMFGLFMQQMRLKPVRRLPIAFGWLTKRGDAATARWMKPLLQQAEIRRDTVHVLRSISAERNLMLDAAECLPPSASPPSSSVLSRTASCLRSTGVVSPSSFRKDGSSRYRTATRSSPLTSPPASRRPSGNGRRGDAPRVLIAPRRATCTTFFSVPFQGRQSGVNLAFCPHDCERYGAGRRSA
jgi:pimeloyl-ACP methyl ester carboxylesterase